MLSFVIWDVSPEIFTLGPLTVRWYGLCFAVAFLIGQQIMYKIFQLEGRDFRKEVDVLTVWMVIATVIGARLGHCLFYEPDIYLNDPIRILKIWEGGLASHGAALAILATIWVYSRKYKDQPFLWLLDRLVITVALAGSFIRLGNLMNSEIVGKPTESNFGFVFVRSASDNVYQYMNNSKTPLPSPVKISYTKGNFKTDTSETGVPILMKLHFRKNAYKDAELLALGKTLLPHILAGSEEDDINHLDALSSFEPTVFEDGENQVLEIKTTGLARHPSQLYESVSCILLMLLLGALYWRFKQNTPRGLLLGIFMVVCFGLRFLYEFLKENQVDFEDGLVLNMGQSLSIPLFLAGVALVIYSLSRTRNVDLISK